jgi:peptidoglycan/xylan/chitin deacetylase (PgdA/CDA1 family)
MWIVAFFAGAVLLLMHLAPFPFLLDWANRDVAMWRVPQPPGGRTVYLTFDDGPNPEATPALLDVLARHQVRATFFIIDRHLSVETAPIVRRAAAEGHGIALHSHTRRLTALSPGALARTLDQAAARLEQLAGVRPCAAFRPHGGGRSGDMMAGLRQSNRRMVGWGMFLWDWDRFRHPDPDRLVPRIAGRAGPGSIIVLHDGHHKNPRADRRYTVETVDRLIPVLRQKGMTFGTICEAVEQVDRAKQVDRVE